LTCARRTQTKGWGVQYVQERKLVLRAMDVPAATEALDELVQTGMTRSRAAELVYGERATPVVRIPHKLGAMPVTRIRRSRRQQQQRSSVRTLCHPSQQNDVQSWAQYMACDGLGGSEYRCVALKYCEGALCACMHSSAFMPDVALFALQTGCWMRRRTWRGT
jgi:hypothetical protein